MTKIALTPNASGTGTFTIAAPNSNTNRTITLPDEDVVLAGPPPELTQVQAEDDTSTVFGTVSGQRLAQAVATQAVGIGQTWQDVKASRGINTSYQNTTGRPIQISLAGSNGRTVQVSDDNTTWIDLGVLGTPGAFAMAYNPVIPDGWYYRLSGAAGALLAADRWVELR